MQSRYFTLAVLTILALTLAACGAQSPASSAPSSPYGQPPAATQMPAPTSAPATALPQATQAPSTGQGVPNTGAASVQVGQNSQFGSILVDSKGMTLYLYTKDSPNTSVCYGKCATSWPPLLANGSSAAGSGLDDSKLGTTARTDGTTQVTYNGWPLYYFAKDHQPGDATGQGIGSVWYVVSPSGDAVK